MPSITDLLLRETFPVGLLGCNCTVLGNQQTLEAMVVDPGADIARILAVIARHNLWISRIVVTHAHIDHIAGALALKQATGAPVLYSKDDLSLVAMMDVQAGWLGVPTPEVAAPDHSPRHAETLAMGTLQTIVLHTPGHTPGSLSLHVPEAALLLAGDTLFAGSIGRTDLPGGDTARLRKTLDELVSSLPESTVVVPGHGAETTIGAERETNPFLQRRGRF